MIELWQDFQIIMLKPPHTISCHVINIWVKLIGGTKMFQLLKK
jgi:hypothetical protein